MSVDPVALGTAVAAASVSVAAFLECRRNRKRMTDLLGKLVSETRPEVGEQ